MTTSALFCEGCGGRCGFGRWEDEHLGVALDGIYANGPRWKAMYDFDVLAAEGAMWRCPRCSDLLRMDKALAARVGRARRIVVPVARAGAC